MKKIAIVGVEGSGKTVMMAAMGEQWERPDERGYFLSPENAEAFGFSKSVMSILRSGRWPNATAHDAMTNLDWSLQRRQGGGVQKIADLSLLDFAGEIYRLAFDGGEHGAHGYKNEIHNLRRYVDEADIVVVLVNLRNVLNASWTDRRSLDGMFANANLLKYVLDESRSRKSKVAIVLSQADAYRHIIESDGGPRATLQKRIPLLANLYDNLPIFAVSAIDKVDIDVDGLPVPARDFKSTGLKGLMDWVIDACQQTYDAIKDRRNRAIELFAQKRYEEAFQASIKEYQDGDDELAYQLAFMYRFGKGVPKDLQQSFKICERILQNGNKEWIAKLQCLCKYSKMEAFEAFGLGLFSSLCFFGVCEIGGLIIYGIISLFTDYPGKTIEAGLVLYIPSILAVFFFVMYWCSPSTDAQSFVKALYGKLAGDSVCLEWRK